MTSSVTPDDLVQSVTRNSIDSFRAQLPNFPSDKIRTCFKTNGVLIDDARFASIPREFSKYFAVMAALANGNLRGKRLLDVGTGLGVFISQAKSLGMTPMGIDIFTEYQETCRQGAVCIFQAYGHAPEDAQQVFVNHDIMKSAVPGNGFDFVTSFGMLEHLFGEDTRREVVHNMMKSVASGGSLIIVCGPNKYFPVDLHHYGPKFAFYHCLPLWGRQLYLRAYARAFPKKLKCRDPKWLNGMKVVEITKHIREIEPKAHILKAFPLWVRLARANWLRRPGVGGAVTRIAKLLSAIHVEPVIILIATKPIPNEV